MSFRELCSKILGYLGYLGYLYPLLFLAIFAQLDEVRISIANLTQVNKQPDDAAAEDESATRQLALQSEDDIPKPNTEDETSTQHNISLPTAPTPPATSPNDTTHRVTTVLAEKLTTGLTAALVPALQHTVKAQIEAATALLAQRLDAANTSLAQAQEARLADLTNTLVHILPQNLWTEELIARLGRIVADEVVRVVGEKRAAAAALSSSSSSGTKQEPGKQTEQEQVPPGKLDPTPMPTETKELLIARLSSDLARMLPEKLAWTDDLVERLGRCVGEVVVRAVAASSSSSPFSSSAVAGVKKEEDNEVKEPAPGKPKPPPLPKPQNQELLLARLTDNLARVLPEKLADKLLLAMAARGLVQPASAFASSASSSSASSGESSSEDEAPTPGIGSSSRPHGSGNAVRRAQLQRKSKRRWVIGQQFPGYGGVEAVRGPVEARIRSLAREEDEMGDVEGAVVEGLAFADGGREGGEGGSAQGDGGAVMAGTAVTGAAKGGGRGKGKGKWKGKGKARAED